MTLHILIRAKMRILRWETK